MKKDYTACRRLSCFGSIRNPSYVIREAYDRDFVLAEISLRSPRKLFVFAANKEYLPDQGVPKIVWLVVEAKALV